MNTLRITLTPAKENFDYMNDNIRPVDGVGFIKFIQPAVGDDGMLYELDSADCLSELLVQAARFGSIDLVSLDNWETDHGLTQHMEFSIK